MFEQVQTFLRHIQDFKPNSLGPHHKESSAYQEDTGLLARLSHSEVGSVFRQAGNRVRMKIRNRKEAGVSSDLNSADIEVGECPWNPSSHHTELQESGQYSVELLRGPSGFGFSLRGGSEYNMDIYVLGLMEGGPAQQCGKIQVSDQLVEVNGEPTAGMTHAQAVEHIRSGGSRIRLVLKRGNGFIPDYDRVFSQSSTKAQQVLEAEDKARHRKPNRSMVSQHVGQNLGDGDDREAALCNVRQQLPKAHQSGQLHQTSSKAQGEEEEDREQGWRPHKQGTNGESESDSHKLLSPRPSRKLRSDLVPGPWLVPSKERLSRALWGVCMGQGEEEVQKGNPVRGKGLEVKRRS